MLDTPTRAAQCGRPRTRGWSDLLEAAKSYEEEAVRLRSELNRYLEEADNFSKRRAARKEARAALLKEASAAATSPRRSVKPASPALAGSSSKTPPPPQLSSSTPAKEKPPLPPTTPLKEKQGPSPVTKEQSTPATPAPKVAAKSAVTTPSKSAAKSAQEEAPSTSTAATPPPKIAAKSQAKSAPPPKPTLESTPATPPPKKTAAKSASKSTEDKAPQTPPQTAKSPAAVSSSARKRNVQDDGVEFEDVSHESVGNLCEILATLSSPWTKRVSALRALSGNESLEISTALAKALCVQLADLRSKVVVDASHTIETHSERLSVSDALFIVSKALGCVSVKKAVMADARETAAIKALAPLHDEDSAWAAVLEHAKNQPTERARVVTVKAVNSWLGVMHKERDAHLAEVLNVCLVDKSGNVRDTGKAVYKEYEKKAGKERIAALKKKLSTEAAGKLPKSTKKKKAGKPKLNMKEEIRRKRLAMKEKEAAASGTEKDGEDGKGFRMAASEASSSKDAAPITTRDLNQNTDNVSIPASPEPAKKKKKLNSTQASPTVLANKENNNL